MFLEMKLRKSHGYMSSTIQEMSTGPKREDSEDLPLNSRSLLSRLIYRCGQLGMSMLRIRHCLRD